MTLAGLPANTLLPRLFDFRHQGRCRYSIHLLIDLLQFQIDQLAPNDSLFGPFPEIRILKMIPDQLDSLQSGKGTNQAVVHRRFAGPRFGKREIQYTELIVNAHSDERYCTRGSRPSILLGHVSSISYRWAARPRAHQLGAFARLT